MRDFFVKMQTKGRGMELLRSIFTLYLHQGNMTIPEVAAKLKYSVPAITKHVADLCEAGCIVELGKTESREGRPATTYGINEDSCFFVGVDVHKLFISIAMINLRGKIVKCEIDKNYLFTDTKASINDICKRIITFISATLSERKNVQRERILNININIAGRVNRKTGYSFSVFNTGELSLSEVLSGKLGYKVTIDNDSRAMVYGEYLSQADNNRYDNVLAVNVGSGVGLGMILGGRLYEGRNGFAGELGHISVYDNNIMCVCGKIGCLETEASATALMREVKERLSRGEESVLSKYKRELTIYDVLDAIIKKEDMLCIGILEQIGIKLGRQIANLINLFSPEKIIIGGLLSVTGDYLLQSIKMSVNKYALSLVSQDVIIEISELQLKSGVIGAAFFARDRALNID